MSAPQSMAEAIRAECMIDDAWTLWAKAEPTDAAPQDEQDAWQAGYEAFEDASSSARDAIREMPCRNLNEVAEKLAWLVSQDPENPDLKPFAMALRDLSAILDRPTQDAFAVKLRAYQRAVQDCDEARTAGAADTVMGPLYSAAFDCGKAVLLEPAPDIAALIEKHRIFDALQYDEDADAPTFTHRLFADAIALAGGAA